MNSKKEKIELLIQSGQLENIRLAFQLSKNIGQGFYEKILFNTEKKIKHLIDTKKNDETPNFKNIDKYEKNNIDIALNFAKGLEEENPRLYEWSKLFDFAKHNTKAYSYYDYGDFYHSIQLLFKYSTFHLYDNFKPFTGLPQNIYILSHLEELYLWGAKIEKLPHSFGELINLAKVYLARNYLQSLPTSFGCLGILLYLNVSENKIEELPNSFCHLNSLKELNLSENKLLSLPDNFGNLKNLKILNISNNYCWEKESGLQKLPKNFGDLVKLEELDLSGNLLDKLPLSFKNLTKLKKLDLSGNQISSFQLNQEHLVNLRYLNLFDNNIPSEEKKEIERKFPNCELIL